MPDNNPLSRRTVMTAGAALLSSSLIAATTSRCEAGSLVSGHVPSADLVRLNRQRLAALTVAEHDRHLRAMLAIPARSPADLAIKLEWLIVGGHYESEPGCPFVATYASVARDLGVKIGQVETCKMQRARIDAERGEA